MKKPMYAKVGIDDTLILRAILVVPAADLDLQLWNATNRGVDL